MFVLVRKQEEIMMWVIIGLFGLLVICTAVAIFCVLNAAEYQEDWDKYDD